MHKDRKYTVLCTNSRVITEIRFQGVYFHTVYIYILSHSHFQLSLIIYSSSTSMIKCINIELWKILEIFIEKIRCKISLQTYLSGGKLKYRIVLSTLSPT